MIKSLISFLLLLKVTFGFSQNVNICSCQGLVDIDYKKSVNIYNKPLKQIQYSLKQDFKNEDYLTFTVDKDSANYFHATFQYEIKNKHYSGWVKKANYLGTYSRVYTGPLRLFTKPNSNSRIHSTIATWTNDLLPIYGCKDKWIFVKTSVNKSFKEGWVKYKDYCSNPYTQPAIDRNNLQATLVWKKLADQLNNFCFAILLRFRPTGHNLVSKRSINV